MSESDTLQTEHICVYHFDPCFVPDFCRTILTSYFLFNLSTLKNYCSLRLHACRHIHFRLLVSMQTGLFCVCLFFADLYISHVSAVADMSIDRVLLLALSACLLISDMSIFRASATCRHVYFLCIVCYQTCLFSVYCMLPDMSIFCVLYATRHVYFLCIVCYQTCLFSVYCMLPDMFIFCVLYATRHVYFLCIVCYQTCPFSKFTLFADTSIFHVSVTCMFISRVSTPCRVPAARLYLAKMNCARQIIVCIEIRIALFKCKRLYQFKNVCLVHLSLACLI